MNNPYNPGDGFTKMSSRYGWRIHKEKPEFHAGQDFSAPEGTRIPSAASGVAVYSGKNEGGYGNLVIVKNDTGGSSVYAHMRGDDQVKPGQRVWQGGTLGRVGNTGKSDGPHLHYSVITEEASKAYDPRHPLAGGSMGLHLDGTNTYDPANYDNYVLPPPVYLKEFQRAAEIMSGDNASAALGKRSDIPNGVTPDTAQITPTASAFPSAETSGLGGILKYFDPASIGAGTELSLADPDARDFSLPSEANDSNNVPERRLVGRVVNLSASSTNAPSLAPGLADGAGDVGRLKTSNGLYRASFAYYR